MLPYGRQCIDDADVDAVCAVLHSDWLTTGPVTPRFEAAFAAHVGAREAVAVSSGTAALHIAAMALGLGRGDSVIVPSVTFLATASAPYFTGADVLFADVDPETGLMTAETFRAAIERAAHPVRAVFPVWLNGLCAGAPEIARIAAAHEISVIEDSCHALGGAYRDAHGDKRRVGGCDDCAMSCFSMHPVKLIAMGEGGMVTTNNAELAERLRLARNHGMLRDPALFTQADEAFDESGEANPWHYEMESPGLNYRSSELHSALGLSQLGKLDAFWARRRELAAVYDEEIAALSGMPAQAIRPAPRAEGCDSGWHLYAARLDFDAAGVGRGAVMRALLQQGVGTQVHYRPVHRQPFWRSQAPELTLPGADAYYAGRLSLPLYPRMRDDDCRRVIAALVDVLTRLGGDAGSAKIRRSA